MSELCFVRLPQAAESPDLILWRTYVKQGFSVMKPGTMFPQRLRLRNLL